MDPSEILPYAGMASGETVADFGCGNGFYPVAAAQAVGNDGLVYAVDVKNDALEATMSAAKHAMVKNVYTICHDMEEPGVPIADGSCDSVILAGILHLSHLQKNVLRESYRVLKTGGKVIVIEWKKQPLPFGPNIAMRIAPEELTKIMTAGGFSFGSDIPADAFHYAAVYNK